jgi:hypothetical protein
MKSNVKIKGKKNNFFFFEATQKTMLYRNHLIDIPSLSSTAGLNPNFWFQFQIEQKLLEFVYATRHIEACSSLSFTVHNPPLNHVFSSQIQYKIYILYFPPPTFLLLLINNKLTNSRLSV